MKDYLGFNLEKLTGTPPMKVAQYANLDNQYMSVLLSCVYGEIAVIRGKAPTTPATYKRNPFMDGDVDMRYWSVGTYESAATTKVVDSAYDEQIPLDDNGYYTIVVSLPEDRPSNAYERYGVKWLNWGENGDGLGHLEDGHLIFRHMLSSPGFGHAIQDVHEMGTEAAVLGEYMPVITYMSKEDFEALGRHPGDQLHK